MWLLTVNPISRGIAKDELYYFSSEKVAEGDLIEVPLRSRMVVAKVDSVKAVIDAKSELKNLPFAVRKVTTLRLPNFFSPIFMEAAKDTAKYFSSTIGAALYSLLPPRRLLSAIENVFDGKNLVSEKAESRGNFVIQSSDEDRFAAYRRMIREEFAKKKSVFLIAPTIAEVIRIFKDVSRGIEEYSFLLHQKLPKRKISEIWKKAGKMEHPILLVSTPLFLGLPRWDLGTIVIERESSRSYKKESRPFIDYRIFIHFLARRFGAQIIRGDSMIRSETFQQLQNGRWYEYGKTSFRSFSSAKTSVILYLSEKARQNKISLSPEVINLIAENRALGGHLFILSPRRGLSPRTICRNCGKSVSCPSCGGSLVLHGEHKIRDNQSSKFLCHRCGKEISAEIRCVRCNSWDLVPLGVGSEKIEIEIKKTFPGINIFRADRDNISRDADADKLVKNFLSSPGSVLVGTELIISRINQTIQTSVVLYPELLTMIPEFPSDEETLRLFVRIKNITSGKFVIQTADSEMALLKWSGEANLSEFYRQELEIRQKLNYPPFSVIILVSWKTSSIIKSQIESIFAHYIPVFFSGFLSAIRKEDRAIIKLKPTEWPNRDLREKLLSLPASVRIEVMPEKIFS